MGKSLQELMNEYAEAKQQYLMCDALNQRCNYYALYMEKRAAVLAHPNFKPELEIDTEAYSGLKFYMSSLTNQVQQKDEYKMLRGLVQRINSMVEKTGKIKDF